MDLLINHGSIDRPLIGHGSGHNSPAGRALAMVYTLTAYTVTAYVVTAYIVTAYIVMAFDLVTIAWRAEQQLLSTEEDLIPAVAMAMPPRTRPYTCVLV